MSDDATSPEEPALIRKYANRRLYNTATGRFVTLDGLRDMVVAGQPFTVIDATTGRDITASVLAQIIAEQESRGESLLPLDVLRQVISLYEKGMGTQLSDYLNRSLEGFTRNMEYMQRLGDLGRRNMEIFHDSLTGLARPPGTGERSSGAPPDEGAQEGDRDGHGNVDPLTEEVRSLRARLEEMQHRLDRLAGNGGD